MKKIFCCLMSNKNTQKEKVSRRGNYIFISVPGRTDIVLPIGRAVNMEFHSTRPDASIGADGFKTQLYFSSNEERELFRRNLLKLLMPSAMGRALKWACIASAAGFAYMVWGAYQQAQTMMQADTAWQNNPAGIEKSLPAMGNNGGIDAILANRVQLQQNPQSPQVTDTLDSLLTKTGPVIPPQDPMAKQLFEQAMSVGREEYMSTIPPVSSSSGLDAFGLSTAGAGCDPALAFDK